ncbi:ABC transporter [Streptomyces xinghaiensis]|uniref:ATP-binding cassette domain-containing protein n=2 Tax=Streptomyces TaxID=1883 RepID=A0A3R7IDX3_9ACTN|nr:ABC transporter [Streptomyces xinghaiensis]RKM99502.1 ATP-binding cassette domain-containing protein [Streptomyces xinghaiensis]RNC76436.1 ATP-binding cassette domain-containing protein [Streptomyces xinghaiensis]
MVLMIEATELTKCYGGTTAVDRLSFTVRPGVVTGFLGPNGAGKTTTLRMVLGLNRPTGGTVTVDGQPFGDHPRGLRRAGALLDAHDVHDGRTARAHLTALAVSNGLPRSRVAEVLTEAGVADVAGRRIGGFSLGMRQRLGIAAALLGDPPVLIFDEPLNGLDPEGVRWVRGLFGRLADEGRTVLVSSHLMGEMEQTADELIVIGRGRLIAAQSLRDFAARTTRPRVSVRTPDTGSLPGLLTGRGAEVRAEGEGLYTVTGLPADRIGELAFTHGVRLHELSPHPASLEEAFMELTAESVEYSAGAAR